jgi:hypothetical protein
MCKYLDTFIVILYIFHLSAMVVGAIVYTYLAIFHPQPALLN